MGVKTAKGKWRNVEGKSAHLKKQTKAIKPDTGYLRIEEVLIVLLR